MRTNYLSTLVTLAAIAMTIAMACGDDDNPASTGGNNSGGYGSYTKNYSQTHGWTCASGENCQDVFNIRFASGSTVTIQATDISDGSIVQIALYAPGTELGGINLFTNTNNELRCATVGTCTKVEGEGVTDFAIATTGFYRLAITRDWLGSCGGDGTYRLAITSDEAFSPPSQTVEDKQSLAPDFECK